MSEVKDKSQAVDSPAFWKERIREAAVNGNIRHSVFRAPEHYWAAALENHKYIIDTHTDFSDKILDAGCGYGRASEFIKCDGYMGVDQSPDFIHEAKLRYGDKEFMVCDLADMPFEDDCFDLSICISLMIMVVQNLGWSRWEPIQNELLRVSKRGVLCLEYGAGDTDTSSDTHFLIKKYQ